MENDDDIIVTKAMLNDLILEALLIDGCADIAATFAQESGIDISLTALESAQKRAEIIQSIVQRRIDKLIDNSSLLSSFSLPLQLRLHQQFVVDLLLRSINDDRENNNDNVTNAWEYLTRTLTTLPITESTDQQIVEETVVLFLYVPFDDVSSSSVYRTHPLFTNHHRQELVRLVNEYLLQKEGLRTTSRLSTLLRIFVRYEENRSLLTNGTDTVSENERETEQRSPSTTTIQEIIRTLITGGMKEE